MLYTERPDFVLQDSSCQPLALSYQAFTLPWFPSNSHLLCHSNHSYCPHLVCNFTNTFSLAGSQGMLPWNEAASAFANYFAPSPYFHAYIKLSANI